MVTSLDIVDNESKERIIEIWGNMTDGDKAHFINQVALALSVWGSDEKGKTLVVEILKLMTENGTSTLADFGLYIEKAIELDAADDLTEKIARASLIIEGYRIKNAMSSEPHLELF